MRTLLSLLRSEVRPFGMAIFLGTLAVGGGIGLMGTGADLISRAALHPATLLLLLVPIAGVRFFSLLRAAARYGERLVSHDLTFRLLANLKVEIFRRLERKTPPALHQTASGEWLRRLSADVDRLQNFYLDGVGPWGVLVLVAGLSAAIMAPFGKEPAVTLPAGLLLTGAAIPLVSFLLERGDKVRLVAAQSRLASRLVDSVFGMADLLMTPDGGRTRALLLEESERAAGRRLRMDGAGAWARALEVLATNLTALAIVWEAVPKVRAGTLPGVDLAVVLLVAIAAFAAVTPLARSFDAVGEDLEAARRMGAPLPKEAPTRLSERSPADVTLRARELSFRYDESGPWVLEEVSFLLPPGRHIALVGSSGAGKSTLFFILTKLLGDFCGEVSLGGRDIRAIPEEDLRRAFAVVTQRPHLFNGTLEENIRIGRPDATRDEVKRAAETAALSSFIASLPDGLDTAVGEQGTSLSGGERQRVALARAVLRDAPLLLLDEPLTGLDSATAAAVSQNLRHFCQGRSVLYITHRPLPGWEMDEVWHLEAGRLSP